MMTDLYIRRVKALRSRSHDPALIEACLAVESDTASYAESDLVYQSLTNPPAVLTTELTFR
jgi:hypothetical protein